MASQVSPRSYVCVFLLSLALSLEKCATCHTLLLCVYWSELRSSSLCSKYFPPSNHLTRPRRVLLILTWILVYAFIPQCIFIAWTEKCFKLLFTSVIRVAYSHWIACKVSQSRTWQFLFLVKIRMRHGVSLLLAAAKAPGCSLLSFHLCAAFFLCCTSRNRGPLKLNWFPLFFSLPASQNECA